MGEHADAAHDRPAAIACPGVPRTSTLPRPVGHNVLVLNLGQLEAKVMDVLWDTPAQPLRVRDVMDRLGGDVSRAYTTVMTVLDNLHRKGWVMRQAEGRGYLYLPVKNREEAAADALREVLSSVADAEAVLLHFARTASDDEAEVLRRGLRRRAPRPKP